MFMTTSPCISICKNDPASGYCMGCGRSSNEKIIWKDKSTSKDWKLNNLKEIQTRMTDYQLKIFKKSYAYKCKNGISLIKKGMKINKIK